MAGTMELSRPLLRDLISFLWLPERITTNLVASPIKLYGLIVLEVRDLKWVSMD